MSGGPISEAFVAILPAIDTAAFSAEVEGGVESAVSRVGAKAFAPLEVQASKAGAKAGAALDESFTKASATLTASAAKTGTKAGVALDASFAKAVAPLGKEAAAAGEKASAVGAGAAKGSKSGLVGLAALAGGYELVKGSIEKAQQRQLDQIRSTEVFGKQALPGVSKAVEDVSKKTLQTIEGTTESVNTLGQALQAVGVTQKQSAGLSEQLAQRVGDVAAKTGKDVGTLIAGVQTSLASGSTRALRSLNVVADNSDIAFTAAKDGLVKVNGQIPQLVAAQTKVAVAQEAYNSAVAKSGAGSTVALAAKKALDTQNTALGAVSEKYKNVAKTLPELVSQQRAVGVAQEKYNSAVDKFGPSSAKAKKAQAEYNITNANFLSSVKAQVPALTKQQKALALTQLILDKTSNSQGAAEKRSKTLSGAVQRLKVAFSNAEEEIGVKLIPVLTKIANVVAGFFDFLEKHKTTAKVLLDVGTALAVGAVAAKAFAKAQLLVDAALNANPVALIVIALAALVTGLVLAYKNSKTFRDIVNKIGSVLKTVLGPALKFVEGHLKLVALIIGTVLLGPIVLLIAAFIKFHDKIFAVVTGVYDFIKGHFALIATIIGTVLLGPIAIVIALFVKFHDKIFAIIGDIVSFFAALPGRVLSALSTFGSVVGDVFVKLGQLVIAIVEKYVSLWLDVYVKFPIRVAQALAGLAVKVAGIFTDVGKRSLSAVTGFISNIVHAITGLPGKIIGIGGAMLKAGAKLIGQLFQGIRNGIGAAGDFGKNIANSIGQAINHFLKLPIKLPRINTHIPGVGTVGGETVLPAIPAFKRGGVIDKATLALLGEAGREVVIPLTNKKRALQLANQSGLLDLLVAQSNRESRGSLAAVTNSRTQSRSTTNHNTFILPSADPDQHAEMVGHRLSTWSDR